MSITEDDIDLLILGARYDDMEDVQGALRQGVPVDSKDEQGRTALHMAAANGHADIAMALLSSGANVDAPNNEGNTPLHYACLNGHLLVVKLLLGSGAIPSVLNSAERTPLDEALSAGHQDIFLCIREHTAANNNDGTDNLPDDVEEPDEGAAAEADPSDAADCAMQD